MATSQSKYGRRFDEEFKREAAALACRPGARQEQVARDLGVSPYGVSRSKKLYGGGEHAPSTPASACAPGVSVAELERRIRALERECADLREQRTILEKSRRHFLRTPAMKRATIKQLAGPHPVRKLCRTLGVARSAYLRRAAEADAPGRGVKRVGSTSPGFWRRARAGSWAGRPMDTMPTALGARAFERAVQAQRPAFGLLHHSRIVAASTPATPTVICCAATASCRA